MGKSAGGTSIELSLIADLACPWCYLGLVRLDRARALRPGLSVQLRWWPFLLNPQMPPEGMDRQAYLRAKFGGNANAKSAYARILEAAAADGIAFALERMPKTPNTLRAHRLILLAERRGLADPMIRSFFQALFVDGRDIGDPDQLIALAAAVGLDSSEVESYLAGSRGASEVVAGHRRAEALGVRGVPVFVVDREHAIAGAQPPEVLVGLLDLAAATRQAPADAISETTGLGCGSTV
jgi:predicted DsbA family dithiol-disulfide isomerase